MNTCCFKEIVQETSTLFDDYNKIYCSCNCVILLEIIGNDTVDWNDSRVTTAQVAHFRNFPFLANGSFLRAALCVGLPIYFLNKCSYIT